MAMTNTKRGFALLIAVIFMSVMLTFGLALSSLSYKQQILASSAVESQYAFYAADTAAECALYADEQLGLFAYANHASPGTLSCGGDIQVIGSGPGTNCYNQPSCSNQWVSSTRLSLDSGTHCADVTVYKPASSGTTYLFSQGYDVSCAAVSSSAGTARFVSRGLKASYSAAAQPSGSQVAYTTPGTYTWVAPAGVTSVSAVCVGGGGSIGVYFDGASYYMNGGAGGALAYANNISVTPGNSYTVVVGGMGAVNGGRGGNSTFNGSSCGAGGGSSGTSATCSNAAGGTVLNGTGGSGGRGGSCNFNPDSYAGGGGAGGYSGAGGAGADAGSNGGDGFGGAGGGGGPSSSSSQDGGGGGGVGLLGLGPSGAGAGTGGSNQGNQGGGGSGGTGGATGASAWLGGTYGGGTAGNGSSGTASYGAVRIIWPGTTRSFPSTNTGDM